MPEITDQQGRAIAYLIHEIRPDWGTQALTTLISNNREVPSLSALVIAATTKAMELTCKTPAPIFHPGPHWPEEARHKLPPGPPCEDHPTFEGRTCRCCWADVKVGQRSPDQVGKHMDQTRFQALVAMLGSEQRAAQFGEGATNEPA
jgi:hypothetical protein